MNTKLTLVTPEEYNELLEEFHTWIFGTVDSHIFNDEYQIRKNTVMEFNANKVGKTIYPLRVEK